jgi:hypothetical protein
MLRFEILAFGNVKFNSDFSKTSLTAGVAIAVRGAGFKLVFHAQIQ